jgi:hypothetical protein
MAKKLVIFNGPQLHDYAYGVRPYAGHPRHKWNLHPQFDPTET